MAWQLLDSSCFTLNGLCFHSNSLKFSETNPGKYRDIVDALRTVYWFHGLRIRAKAQTTYQMEKIMEPDAFRIDATGGKYRRNKWNGYRLGKHTPSAKLIGCVNEKLSEARFYGRAS